MPVALLPKIQKLVRSEREKIVQEQVTNWQMGFAIGKLATQYFNGKKITYGGITFAGSPQSVFWSRYIEPYLEDITDRLIKEISRDCSENNLNIADELDALAENLKGMYTSVFDEMARAEQKMLGKGYPDRIPKRDVWREIASMNGYS